ncbi:Flp family type IVb pilin [Rhizobium sp. YIM 134829]|uniref:Flp family type IVb pilin n=1 Tax=Rhizobium sp. YIM 134829 TaxID=3390453 RepID=UPI0039793C3C
MKALMNRLLKARSGATAVEYGLIGGLLAVVIIVAFGNFSTALTNMFTYITDVMANAWK